MEDQSAIITFGCNRYGKDVGGNPGLDKESSIQICAKFGFGRDICFLAFSIREAQRTSVN